MSFKDERVFKAGECNFCFVDTELSQMMMKVGVFTDVVLQNSFFRCRPWNFVIQWIFQLFFETLHHTFLHMIFI